jgi:hypothetical protein
MEWGLIPVCSVQSGYEGFSGIRNISIDNMEKAVETINNLQSVPEEQLKKWQQVNLAELENHFNCDRFCGQVLDEIESKDSRDLAETSLKLVYFFCLLNGNLPIFGASNSIIIAF